MSEPETKAPDDWRRLHAYGWPAGSVRALLALSIFGGVWFMLLMGRRVPDYLEFLLFIILGHYFAARGAQKKCDEPGADPGPPPLYLPKGTVRFLLLGGFVAVAGALYSQDRLLSVEQNEGLTTLVLVSGFLLGVLLTRFYSWVMESRRPPRIIEDIRATFCLVSAGVLLLIVFALPPLDDPAMLQDWQKALANYRPQDILAGIVGFYFGSRS